MILYYAFRRTLNIATAEEVTSNTFFKALRALPAYQSGGPGGQPIRAWLYAVANNELRMHWRWRRRHPAMSLEDLDPAQRSRVVFAAGSDGLDRQVEREELEERMADFAALHRSLAQLPQRYQTVLALRYFERLTLEQIAQVTARPLGSVKSRLHRATARLRRLLEGAGAARAIAASGHRAEQSEPTNHVHPAHVDRNDLFREVAARASS
jgi:RNA polymerase sigma-70 factor (ECF subfamily)